MTTATYTKLRSGEWGIRLGEEAPNAAGTIVDVTKRSGETKSERIGRVLWTGKGITLCTIERSAPRRSSRSRGEDGCHTDGNCSSLCNPSTCPCGNGSWFDCC